MRRSFREVTRSYFARESNLEFAIEALFFAIIVATSAWPIFATAGELNEFLQRAALSAAVAGIGDAGQRISHSRLQQRVADNAFHLNFLQRENLDSKLIAFSMLALCKTTVQRQTIGKLNANFCLGGCRIS